MTRLAETDVFAFNSTMKEGQYGYIFGTNPGSGSIVGISTGIPGNLNVSWEKAQKAKCGTGTWLI